MATDDTATATEDAALLASSLDSLRTRTDSLTISANSFARALSSAFTGAASGGKTLDSVLQTLYLRLSNLALTAAFKPIASGITGGINDLFSGVFGSVKPFAAGGVVATPTYFPLNGGLGVAGEAGPEAILPLVRGADGRLGVANGGGAVAANVTVHISTPDVDSFRRSEAYLAGQIARAVARGQRTM